MGPLDGYRIIEIAGVGPSQYAGMLLADMGASVIRLVRPSDHVPALEMDPRFDIMNRSRPAVTVDLKTDAGRALVLALCADADALFEGFRPGVMERLGVGPEECLSINPGLIYGRMTGFGQDGALADAAGHDPNYIALAGVLGCIGEPGGDPIYPLNLVGDMGGGGTFLALGILAGLLSASKTGVGQVVDAAMVDGAASLMTMVWGMRAAGTWADERGVNLMDGGAPFARPYRTRDNRHIVIAPIEQRFFEQLLEELGISDVAASDQHDRLQWPRIRKRFETVFETKTRDEWCDLLEGTDTCFTPVLGLGEVADHPHNASRNTFVNVNGIRQPAAAPRFSETPSAIRSPAASPCNNMSEVLADWGAGEQSLAAARSIEQDR